MLFYSVMMIYFFLKVDFFFELNGKKKSPFLAEDFFKKVQSCYCIDIAAVNCSDNFVK